MSGNAETLVEYAVPATFAAATLYLLWAGPNALTVPDVLARRISLREAAERLYTEFRGTTVGSLMEGSVGTAPDGILDNAAAHILHRAPVEVKRSPSTKWERLDPLAAGGLMECNGATGVKIVWRRDIAYPEARLKLRDLKRLIQQYRAENDGLRRLG